MDETRKELLAMFGKQIVEDVYDESCDRLQRLLSGRLRGKKNVELYKAFCRLDPASAGILREFLVEAVDSTFVRLLNYFDVHEVPLYFKTDVGELVDVRSLSDGLAAEPYNEWGWIAKYSKFKNGIQPAG